jgi:uncharacterized membrane protein YdjX (TVP38/TMEM64 family)
VQLNVSTKQTVATIVVIVVSVAACWLLPPVRSAVADVTAILTTADAQTAITAFKNYLLGFGPWAPLVSALLMVFQAVVAPLPAFVITFANGMLFGWAWGALLSWSSAMLGAAVCFWIARALGRPAVEKLVGGTTALEVSDLFFTRYGDKAVVIARLLPFVSFDIISYGAGLTSIGFLRYFVATGLGQLPATLLYSYLGQNLTGSILVLFWVFTVTLAIFLLGAIVGPPFIKRLRVGSSRTAQGVSRLAPDRR